MTRRIYLAYHMSAPRIESDTFRPIHVGRRGSTPFMGLIGDDTGDNISEKNASYCELTALYWIWKNDTDAAFKGLMHYRRLLDFNGQFPKGASEKFVGELDITQWISRSEAWLDNALEHYDVVLPRKHVMGVTVRKNFAKAHNAADFDLARQAIAEFSPEFLPAFDHVAENNEVRLGNIAVMRSDIFDRYCAWLFSVLERVEGAERDRDHYNPYQNRYIGFLSERLFTVFMEHETRRSPGLKLRETAILNLSRAVVTPYSTEPALNNSECVNIAFSADRAYLPHAAAMLRSLLDHADTSRKLNLFFLHNNIAPQSLALLESVVAPHDNARLEAINVGRRFRDSYRSESRAPSNATYNRFLLFDLLPGLDRLLYLDVDVIVRRDICKLYDTELGEAKIGAVTDWIMARTLTGPVSTSDPNVPDLYEYQRQKLGLSDEHIARYFNAGVLLFNFAAMGDLSKVSSELMKMVDAGGMLFRDQDILNIYFKDDLKLLDPRWNVFNSSVETYGKVPLNNHQKAMAARKDPWLVHYADGSFKPWNDKAVLMAEHYWSALYRTPFFSEVVVGLSAAGPNDTRLGRRSALVRAGKTLSERVPVLRKPLLKTYAALRQLAGTNR